MLNKTPARRLILAAVCAAVGLGSTLARAQDNPSAQQAIELFKAMSQSVSGQQAFSFKYDSNIEIVTTDLQKLTFASSGSIAVSRPDKIRMTRTGGFTDVELAYDGKAITMLGKNMNVFVAHPMTGSLDTVIDALRADLDLDAPAADLLSSNPAEVMLANVTDAKDLGSGVIGGVECDHLAFRTPETDWQIWITQGEKPRPCRLTITSKTLALAPEYAITITEWTEGAGSAEFTLKAPAGAKTVEWDQLSGLGDVPAALVQGAAQ